MTQTTEIKILKLKESNLDIVYFPALEILEEFLSSLEEFSRVKTSYFEQF